MKRANSSEYVTYVFAVGRLDVIACARSTRLRATDSVSECEMNF